MNKVEFLNGAQMAEYYEDYVWDIWFEWRKDKAGVESGTDEWHNMLSDMPKVWQWYVDFQKEVVDIIWPDGEDSIPFSEFFHDEDEQPDLTMIWHSNYYDGPLSGMAKFNDEYVWFDLLEEDHSGNRLFGLYRLSEDDLEAEQEHHKEFQEAVGYHCDHDPKVNKPFVCKDKKKFKAYYAKKREPRELSKPENLIGKYYWYQFKQWARPRNT